MPLCDALSCAECRYDSSRHALARRGGVCGRAPSLPYTQSDPPGRDAAEPVYHLRGRCPEVFLGCADQGLWWTGRTEDRQRAVARIAACGRVSRRHSYHQRTERTGGFGQVFFVQHGVCVAIQRQQERASAVGFRVRLGCSPQYWVQYRYAKDAYGYADACPANDSLYSSFDINWAVDEKGNPVALDHIDYIRVMTGIFQYCGWLGETSTEITSVVDLHLIDGYDENPYVITPRERPTTGILLPTVNVANRCTDKAYYTLTGQRVDRVERGKIYIHQGKKVVF